jgi:hypothetical protein
MRDYLRREVAVPRYMVIIYMINSVLLLWLSIHAIVDYYV